MMQDVDVNMFCNFQNFCVRKRDMKYFMRKMTKTPLKNQQIPPCTLQKFFTIFCNVFTIFGSWPIHFTCRMIFYVFVDFSTRLCIYQLLFWPHRFFDFPWFDVTHDVTNSSSPTPQKMLVENTFLTIP